MPFKIIRNDITKVEADAIVNAANSMLEMGGGVCGAIFSAAGREDLRNECRTIGSCETGKAVITKGYSLPAKYIIHTVGPVWNGGNEGEPRQLYNCYEESLKLANRYELESIAFPLIASGIFGYPKEKALNTAISAIGDFLSEHEMMVYLVVYDKKSFEVSKKRLYEVEKYIDDNYIDEMSPRHLRYSHNNKLQMQVELNRIEEMDYIEKDSFNKKSSEEFDDSFIELDESFSQMLLRLIDERGMTDPETYKRANITRKHFSKIKNKKDYNPKRETALALAVALMLNTEDIDKLLRTTGMVLSSSKLFDVIFSFHIEQGIYDIYKINQVLFAYDQPLLGA